MINLFNLVLTESLLQISKMIILALSSLRIKIFLLKSTLATTITNATHIIHYITYIILTKYFLQRRSLLIKLA